MDGRRTVLAFRELFYHLSGPNAEPCGGARLAIAALTGSGFFLIIPVVPLSPVGVLVDSNGSSGSIRQDVQPCLFEQASSKGEFPSSSLQLSVILGLVGLGVFSLPSLPVFPKHYYIGGKFPPVTVTPAVVGVGEVNREAAGTIDRDVGSGGHLGGFVCVVSPGGCSGRTRVASVVLSYSSTIVLLSLNERDPHSGVSVPASFSSVRVGRLLRWVNYRYVNFRVNLPSTLVLSDTSGVSIKRSLPFSLSCMTVRSILFYLRVTFLSVDVRRDRGLNSVVSSVCKFVIVNGSLGPSLCLSWVTFFYTVYSSGCKGYPQAAPTVALLVLWL